jgi:hypothetical protein
MPPYIDLEPHKAEIIDLLHQKTTHEAIRTILQDKYQIKISRTSLNERLQRWRLDLDTNLRFRTTKATIHDRVKQLLPRHNTKDILRILDHEGTPTSEMTIRRLRADLGIKLRLSPEERVQQLNEIEGILISEYVIGEIENFGRRALHRHLQSMGLFYTE